jgi:CRISPR-associated protein Cas1
MRTLFIDRKNAELEIDRGRLLVRIAGNRPHFSVPTKVLEMLVISAPVQFSSTLMTQLTQENIVTVFINPRKAEACTLTTGMMHNDAERRLLQYRVITDAPMRFMFAQTLMKHKLRAQRVMLQKALRTRLDCRLPLTKGIGRLNGLIEQLPNIKTIESLRGLEGAGSAFYFEAYQTLFAPSLQFNGRNRRPPRDPVNALLSLTYTLLHAEAVRTLFAVGFDPLLGIYHEPCFGRESLACDLVELFRPYAELWVWRLFATETLRGEYFSQEANIQSGACLLGKRGREVYYGEYECKARLWRRLMRRVARHWLAQVQLAS